MIELSHDNRRIKLTIEEWETEKQIIVFSPVPISKHAIIQDYQAKLIELFCDNQFHIGSTLADTDSIEIIRNILILLRKDPNVEIELDSLSMYDIQKLFFTSSETYSDDPVRQDCQLKLEEDSYLLPSFLAKIHKLDFFTEAVKASKRSREKRETSQS